MRMGLDGVLRSSQRAVSLGRSTVCGVLSVSRIERKRLTDTRKLGRLSHYNHLVIKDLAERGGFEPPVQVLTPYNRLAICPVRPLQHLSATTHGRPHGPWRPRGATPEG